MAGSPGLVPDASVRVACAAGSTVAACDGEPGFGAGNVGGALFEAGRSKVIEPRGAEREGGEGAKWRRHRSGGRGKPTPGGQTLIQSMEPTMCGVGVGHGRCGNQRGSEVAHPSQSLG